jgi:DNA replication and repair protein RecF
VIIQKLDVDCFRNIEKACLSFSPAFNFISGRNAQGKTNLLESIHFFSLGRSFRTRRSDDVVKFGKESARLALACKSDSGVSVVIGLVLERGGGIRVSVNGRRLGGLSEIIGMIPTVIFTPEDVLLTSGPPQGRRVYLDYTAAQISPSFLNDLKEYRRALRQRNALLKQAPETGGVPDGLAAWDELLVDKGDAVVRGRREILGELVPRVSSLFGDMLPGGEELTLDYLCSFDPEGSHPGESLRAAIERVREDELRRGFTLCGPHYDDMYISAGGIELRRYGSQGRKRLAAIVLKLAQAQVILERRAERPVVLLDDILSELDVATTGRVQELLTDQYQSFLTSPRIESFPVGRREAAFFVVEGGSIEPANQ